jgi:hypothetical protein
MDRHWFDVEPLCLRLRVRFAVPQSRILFRTKELHDWFFWDLFLSRCSVFVAGNFGIRCSRKASAGARAMDGGAREYVVRAAAVAGGCGLFAVDGNQ